MEIKDFRVNPDSSVPMYRQIVDFFNERIERGEFKEGDRLPSEGELMEALGVSRITIRSAVDEMQKAGRMVRSRGKGTFITEGGKKDATGDEESFVRSCAAEGRRAESDLLEVSWVYPTLQDMKFFKVLEDTNVLCVKKLWLADKIPAMIETGHFSHKYGFLQEEDLAQSFKEIMMKHKRELHRQSRTVHAYPASQQEAGLLQIDKGDSLLLLTTGYTDESGMPACIIRQRFNTKMLKLYLE